MLSPAYPPSAAPPASRTIPGIGCSPKENPAGALDIGGLPLCTISCQGIPPSWPPPRAAHKPRGSFFRDNPTTAFSPGQQVWQRLLTELGKVAP